mgnify:CR=1 FL=1
MVLFYNTVSQGKAKTVALSDRAGSKEWIKNTREIFCSDTVSIICD